MTDAKGTRVSASTTIYTILRIHGSIKSDGTRVQLAPGKTYRVLGTLFTIPEGLTIEMGSIWEADGGGWAQVLILEGANAEIHINRHGEELYRVYGIGTDSPQRVHPGEEYSALQDPVAHTEAYGYARDYLDEFIASRGKLPEAQ